MSWNLFKHMVDTYDLTLIGDELNEIRNAVHADDAEAAKQAAVRDADCLKNLTCKIRHPVSDDCGGMA